MQLTESIYMVGSGKWGFGFTHALDCNVFLIKTNAGCIMVDSGVNLEPQRIVAVMEAHGVKPADVKILLLTHWHGDHAGGAAFFQRLTGCKAYAPAREAAAIAAGDEEANSVGPSKGGLYPADYVFEACPVSGLEDGQSVTLGNVTLTGYAVPGHSLEGLVYYGAIDGKQCIFTGDSVFAAGQVLLQSLWDASLHPYKVAMNKVAGLKVDGFFPGHGVFNLENGGDHIKVCADKFNSGLVPPQLFYFA